MIGLVDSGPGQHDDIQSANHFLVQTKTLPDLSLNSVTANCGLKVFTRNGHTKPRVTQIVGACQQGKVVIPDPARLLEDIAEFGRLK